MNSECRLYYKFKKNIKLYYTIWILYYIINLLTHCIFLVGCNGTRTDVNCDVFTNNWVTTLYYHEVTGLTCEETSKTEREPVLCGEGDSFPRVCENDYDKCLQNCETGVCSVGSCNKTKDLVRVVLPICGCHPRKAVIFCNESTQTWCEKATYEVAIPGNERECGSYVAIENCSPVGKMSIIF